MAYKFEQRTLKPAEAKEQLAGSKRLAPGIWVDREGGLHLSVPEILAHFALEDTAENRAQVTEMFTSILRSECPDATIIEQEIES